MIERKLIEIEGLVQGVGFRPFVHALATRLSLRGQVHNARGGVSIDVEGESLVLDRFVLELTTAPPKMAVVERVRFTPARPGVQAGFRIARSSDGAAANVAGSVPRVSPDIATCADCVRELFDPADRRFRYPFLSCSQCGPRLTIQLGVPYDRATTTMAGFPLCDPCSAEYDDPADRRFHAQTTACPRCGPSLEFSMESSLGTESLRRDEAIRAAGWQLRAGDVVAIKGLGGYHLACDATNAGTVRLLRQRKHRDAKPFAVMARDLAAARELAYVSADEAGLLESPQRPIVLLVRRPGGSLAGEVAPDNRLIGVMLPYTPLHHVLLADIDGPLVMTSGNRSDEPIAYRDADARKRLAGIADGFLSHDRGIVVRCDDSVVRFVSGVPLVIRRARGFAPRPVALPLPLSRPALAVGGHLKQTFCLGLGRAAFLSQHIGDLHDAGTYAALQEHVAQSVALLGIVPEVVAHDLHPDYLSTRFAERWSAEVRLAVQHHHAHIASCLAEHGVDGPAIGVAFDGTGLGTDGATWGGEILLVNGARFERMAHLAYVPLPGGDAVARHPWRAAISHLWAAYDGDLARAPSVFLDRIPAAELAVVRQLLHRPALAPPSSSVGRLFDAVAALLGIRQSVQFEAQAAVELEMIADPASTRRYPVDLTEAGDGWQMNVGPLVRAVAADLTAARSLAEIAGGFHFSLADATATVVRNVARRSGVRRVALSGGSFQNALLTRHLRQHLTSAGFTVLVHREVPCNDGGLSLGQLWIAAAHLRGEQDARSERGVFACA